MKTVLVKAKSGKGDDSKSFEEEFDVPETISEAVDQYGDEEVYSCWYQQLIIRLQAGLRRPEGVGGKVGAVKRDIYQKMLDAGIDPATASQISGYTPPA